MIKKRLALIGAVVLFILFIAMVIVGLFAKESFYLFIGLMVATTLFGVFLFAILMFIRLREKNDEN